MKHKLVAIFR